MTFSSSPSTKSPQDIATSLSSQQSPTDPVAIMSHSPSLSPVDLRHMTSSSVLVSPVWESVKERTSVRTSQALQIGARVGSKSPTSIPSSPTSVQSSSSAIFERDIEPIVSQSPPHSGHPPNPHRIPRAKASEQLEQSVPSVLDSAAEILTGLEDNDSISEQVAVLAPTPMVESRSRSGFTSPIDSYRSRSPSPFSNLSASGGNKANLLLHIPQSIPPILTQTSNSSVPPSNSSPTSTYTRPPTSAVSSDAPSVVTPTSAYFSTASSVDGDEDSPLTTTRERPPSIPASHSPPASFSPLSTTSSHPPSPNHVATKRLSFMSYSDLLSSTPASSLPLSALTTSASTAEPPPHIPSVTGFNQHSISGTGSAAASLRGFSIHGGSQRNSIILLDDVGGEWEREGMGRGLEERLEALQPTGKA